MFRSSTQSIHDQRVLDIANYLNKLGYYVWADHNSSYNQPDKIYGYIPDIYAKKMDDNGNIVSEEIVIEVETEDSVNQEESLKQALAFTEWESGNRSIRKFFLEVAK